MKQYEIYLVETDEVLATGYNDFTAMNSLVSLRGKHGEDNVKIRWIEREKK